MKTLSIVMLALLTLTMTLRADEIANEFYAQQQNYYANQQAQAAEAQAKATNRMATALERQNQRPLYENQPNMGGTHWEAGRADCHWSQYGTNNQPYWMASDDNHEHQVFLRVCSDDPTIPKSANKQNADGFIPVQ